MIKRRQVLIIRIFVAVFFTTSTDAGASLAHSGGSVAEGGHFDHKKRGHYYHISDGIKAGKAKTSRYDEPAKKQVEMLPMTGPAGKKKESGAKKPKDKKNHGIIASRPDSHPRFEFPVGC